MDDGFMKKMTEIESKRDVFSLITVNTWVKQWL